MAGSDCAATTDDLQPIRVGQREVGQDQIDLILTQHQRGVDDRSGDEGAIVGETALCQYQSRQLNEEIVVLDQQQPRALDRGADAPDSLRNLLKRAHGSLSARAGMNLRPFSKGPTTGGDGRHRLTLAVSDRDHLARGLARGDLVEVPTIDSRRDGVSRSFDDGLDVWPTGDHQTRSTRFARR